jgi:hypothetical protein
MMVSKRIMNDSHADGLKIGHVLYRCKRDARHIADIQNIGHYTSNILLLMVGNGRLR